MVLRPTSTSVHSPSVVKGVLFGARGGSCSCDPCDCNPCHCGDSTAPNPPLWRVSGCVIEEGYTGETDLSHLIVLSLAQPDEEGNWEEILLVEPEATAAQIAGLLAFFEDDLASLPAEIGPQPPARRAVYRAPLSYVHDATRPLLRATLTREQTARIRPGEQREHPFPREWVYDGPMALRGTIERHV